MTRSQFSQRDLSHTVVVGVDGTEDNLGALRFAATEATVLGAALKVVHVVPDHLPSAAAMPPTPEEMFAAGHAILRAAERVVRGLAPDLPIESWLQHGTRPLQLVWGAEGAMMLVVGRDGRSLIERLLRGDTATGVAARAEVPVVEVPAEWRPPPADAERVVVVGVEVLDRSATLLADGFTVAGKQRATLVVLHARKLPRAYSDTDARIAADEWVRQATLKLEDELRDWRARFPEVKVEICVVHEQPSDALIEASRQADLVVLARRDRGMPSATHLGSTARAVLRGAHCPVRVIAPFERT